MTNDSNLYIAGDSLTSPNWGTLTIGAADHSNEICETVVSYGSYVDKPKERSNMRALYRIIVVNPKTEEVREPIMVIAKDEAAAKMKALLKQCFSGNIDDYDILAECVGDVRAKKDVQKVKVVKEDEE